MNRVLQAGVSLLSSPKRLQNCEVLSSPHQCQIQGRPASKHLHTWAWLVCCQAATWQLPSNPGKVAGHPGVLPRPRHVTP